MNQEDHLFLSKFFFIIKVPPHALSHECFSSTTLLSIQSWSLINLFSRYLLSTYHVSDVDLRLRMNQGMKPIKISIHKGFIFYLVEMGNKHTWYLSNFHSVLEDSKHNSIKKTRKKGKGIWKRCIGDSTLILDRKAIRPPLEGKIWIKSWEK